MKKISKVITTGLFAFLLSIGVTSIPVKASTTPQVISGDVHSGILNGDGKATFYGSNYSSRVVAEANRNEIVKLAYPYIDGLEGIIQGGGIQKYNSYFTIGNTGYGSSLGRDKVLLTNTGSISIENDLSWGHVVNYRALDSVSESTSYRTSDSKMVTFSERIKDVAVNDQYSFVLFESGRLTFTNDFHANKFDVDFYTQINYWTFNSNNKIKDISASGNRLFIVDEYGEVIEINTSSSTLTSKRHTDLKNIQKVSYGKEFLLALDNNGKLYNKPIATSKTKSYMYNSNNEIKFFDSVKNQYENPKIVDFSAGAYHFVALDSNGSLWTWGVNNKKQLGRDWESNFAVKVANQTPLSGVANISGQNSVSKIQENENKVYNKEVYTADPVDTSTGAFAINEKSLLGYGGTYPFTINISFNSLLKTNYISSGKGLGLGYNSGWLLDDTLVIESDSSDTIVLLNEAFNKKTNFLKDEDSQKFLPESETTDYRYIEKIDNKIHLKMKNEETYIFNSVENGNGLLHKIVKENIYEEEFFYEGSKLTKITQKLLGQSQEVKRSYYLTYNEKFQLINIKNDLHQEVGFTYEDKGNALEEKLTSIIYPNGSIEKFTYNEKGLIKEIQIDDEVPYVKNEYDEHNRVIKQYDSRDSITTFVYDEDSIQGKLITTVTNREGQREKFLYDENLNLLEKTNALGDKKVFTYDSNRNKISEINELGQKIEYSYNDNHQVTKVKDHLNRETIITYDEKYNVTSVSDLLGNVTTNEYNSNGQLIKTIHPNGKIKEYVYQNGLLVSEKVNRETIYNYEYSGFDLIKIKKPNGDVITYEKDLLGQITKEIDAKGNETLYEYDNAGNLIKMTDSIGNITTHSYDSYNQLIKTIDAKGIIDTYEYNGNGSLISHKRHNQQVTYDYNKEEYITKETSAKGNIFTKDYDLLNRLVTETDAEGNKINYTYNQIGKVTEIDFEDQITKFEYDLAGNVSKKIMPNGAAYTYEYDAMNRLTKETNSKGHSTLYEYDLNGNMTKSTDANGKITRYIYDQNDDLIKTIDSKGNESLFEYNIYGQLIKSTNALGQSNQYTYDKNGNLIQSFDALGNFEKNEYDSLDRLVKTIDREGSSVSFKYDSLGNLTEVYDANGVKIKKYTYDHYGNVIKETDALGQEITKEYDADNNLVSVINSLNNQTKYSYNNNGEIVQSIDPIEQLSTVGYTPQGYVDNYSDTNRNTTNYVYNKLGQVIKETNATGNYSTYNYDEIGNLTNLKNARNQEMTYLYDNVGNVTKKTDLDGVIEYKYDDNYNLTEIKETENGAASTVKRTYDPLNRVLSYTDTYGNKILYEYDEVGNMSKMTYPNNKAVVYSYDKVGNLLSVKDWNNNQTNYTYDANHRLIKTENANGTIEIRTYDPIGQLKTLINKKSNGEIISSYDFEYDSTGNVIQENDENYSYDELGRIISSNDNNYTYDAMGNILLASKTVLAEDSDTTPAEPTEGDGDTTPAEPIEGDGDTTPAEPTEGGGDTTSTEPTEGGGDTTSTEPTEGGGDTTSTEPTEGGGDTTSTEPTEGDGDTTSTEPTEGDGDTTSTEPTEGGGDTTSTEPTEGDGDTTPTEPTEGDGDTTPTEPTEGDGDTTPTEPTGGDGDNTPTNPMENRYIEKISTFTYGLDNRLATYNEETLVMDSDGNLTNVPLNGKQLGATYDSRNRLTSIGDTTYRYDMENTRISKTENSKETRFTYNTNAHLSQLIMETDSSGNPTAYYIYGVGLVSKINVESNSSGQLEENTYYYHFDRRGSTVAITDLEGSIVNSYKYDIYGELLEEIEEVDNSLQYNGQYGVYTDDNGLYYMRSRYYNPEIKRFINRDVIVGSVHESQSLNRFAYVNGNPISFIDPFGLERETDTKKKVTWTQILDGTQLVLSVVGFIPVLGEIADIVNALISLGRGDVAGALLDIASAIPGAGNVVAAGRVAVNAGKVVSGAGKVADVCKSFGVGTLVLTKEGLVPIEDVQLGDYVLAKDVETGDIDYKEVITLFERVAEEGSYIITVEGEEIVATPNHPFWVEGKGWLRADELTIDDFFVDEEGNKLDIISIEIDLNSLVVYNFEVEDYHTYFVGNSNIFTHNKSKCPNPSKKIKKGKHFANVRVEDSQGNVKVDKRYESGNMTEEEKAMGWPLGSNASHTEARAVRENELSDGDKMTITGQYPPCNSCKGYMNRAIKDVDAEITYRWREEGKTKKWSASKKK